MDIFEIMLDEANDQRWKYESINYTIGRLNTAIRFKSKERQLELLAKIRKDLELIEMKYPESTI